MPVASLVLGRTTYCELATADAYHATHHAASVWEAATDEQKARGLITATRLLDERIEWEGQPQESLQPLGWPRTWLEPRFGPGFDWWWEGQSSYPPTYYTRLPDYPVELQHATAEYARYLIGEPDRTEDSVLETEGQVKIMAGDVSVEYDGTARAKSVPDAVWYLIPARWMKHERRRPKAGRAAMMLPGGRW